MTFFIYYILSHYVYRRENPRNLRKAIMHRWGRRCIPLSVETDNWSSLLYRSTTENDAAREDLFSPTKEITSSSPILFSRKSLSTQFRIRCVNKTICQESMDLFLIRRIHYFKHCCSVCAITEIDAVFLKRCPAYHMKHN